MKPNASAPRKVAKTQLRLMEQTKRSPLIKVLQEDRQPRYCLADGTRVGQMTAQNCIRLGLVVPQKDGLFDDSQSWAAP